MPYPADPLVSTDVEQAARRLRAGGLVAMPTETVYGLAADAENRDAVARIFAVKGRPADHPLIVHLASFEHLDGWATDVTDAARELAAVCWPGPLTMLLWRGPRTLLEVTGHRETVGIRVPSHPVAQHLLSSFGGGVAAPSANRFGRVSPTTAHHVADDLGPWLDPALDTILDGGQSFVGVESTIVDLTVSPPQILRAGAISSDEIARILDREVVAGSGPSRASGMLASHYAPECTIELVDTADEANDRRTALAEAGHAVGILDRSADAVAAAYRLYDDLRDADRRGLERLIVVQPPPVGIGLAVRERLSKAAADRPGSSSRAG